VAGKGIFNAFADEIATPIGMEDYRASDGAYVRETVSQHAAYTFRMSARDLARYMLLYLRGGHWGDRQLVAREWIESSTHGGSAAGDDGTYGMLWWIARDGQLVPEVSLDSGTFAARGNGPHYAVAIPSRNLIIVHLADTDTPSPANWVERKDVGRLVRRILAAKTLH
jgi:CubicO group peptidase (beta-lactamase class C family)